MRKHRSRPPVVALATGRSAPRDPAWMNGIVEAWAQYLADLLSLRCSFFLRKGHLVRWVGEDAPVFDEQQPQPQCQACQQPLTEREHRSRRVLCAACRNRPPTVELGPTLADVMYRTSHHSYVFDEMKKEVIRTLRAQQEAAFDAMALAQQLSASSYEAHQGAGNVIIDRAFVNSGGCYDAPVLCGVVEAPVSVGGLGADLHEQVVALAVDWLMALDERIRGWFGIPISNDAAETTSVRRHIELFAEQIANRVALLEPDGAKPRRLFGVRGLEHRAKAQFVNEEEDAEEQCETDCEAMKLLGELARHGVAFASRWNAVFAPARREGLQQLLQLLQAPPPELLSQLPTVAHSMYFAMLRDVLGNATEAGKTVTIEAVEAWRQAIQVEALCLLLERATRKVEQWQRPKGNFVETLMRLPRTADPAATRVQLRLNPAALLPPVPWARTADRWQLVPREWLAVLRTGLRPTGLRIVLLCSALRQLLGRREDEPDVFAPGVIGCRVLHLVSVRALRAAESAYTELGELIAPLMAGIECAVAKHQLSHWQGSHLEEDIRNAARHVSRFSLQELTEVFDVDALSWDGNSLQLVSQVQERLVFKQTRGGDFVGVVSKVLGFALPLLRQHRTEGLGWSLTTRSSVAGDLLQLLPSVRSWLRQGGDTPLQVTRAEVYNTAAEVKRLLENLQIAREVALRRVRIDGKANDVWCFEGAHLARLLGPHLLALAPPTPRNG